MQKDHDKKKQEYGELSAVWQELLGGKPGDADTEEPAEEEAEAAIPTIESDPWSTLVHAKGVETVDLEKLHLHMSEQDVEQMLEVMREQPAQKAQDSDDRGAEKK